MSLVFDHLDAELLEPDGFDVPTSAAPWPSLATVSAAEPQLQAWLARIAEQDEAAMAAFYQATFSRVMGLCTRILRDPHAAEEAVEDSFWQVWRQAPRFDPARGSALAWLLNMARSRALDALRARQRAQAATVSLDALAELGDDWQAERSGDSASEPAMAADPLECLSQQRAARQLRAALAELPALPRQLVTLAFLRGLTHEEVAEQTGLALGTVKSHIRRALTSLRNRLDANPGKDVAS